MLGPAHTRRPFRPSRALVSSFALLFATSIAAQQ